MRGMIFDIQRFSVHDGPGIRTTVFFIGCAARCGWCHNPESLSNAPRLMFYPERCAGCGKCLALCPRAAHSAGGGNRFFDRNRCEACGACAAECFSGALAITGRSAGIDEIMFQIMEDKIYYDRSGGGATLSGGEPVLQTDFCGALLKRLKEENVHTCLQTSGFYPYEKIEKLLPYVDLIMYDLKAVSEKIYEEHIHGDMRLCFGNLVSLGGAGVPLVVRTPVVGGVNDFEDEIKKIAEKISGLNNLLYYQLVPYHGLARAKYEALGAAFTDYAAPSFEKIGALEKIASNYVQTKT